MLLACRQAIRNELQMQLDPRLRNALGVVNMSGNGGSKRSELEIDT